MIWKQKLKIVVDLQKNAFENDPFKKIITNIGISTKVPKICTIPRDNIKIDQFGSLISDTSILYKGR